MAYLVRVMSGRKSLNLNGYENEHIRVIRQAEGDETPSYKGAQKFWLVQCKTCEQIKARRASVVVGGQGCASCRARRMNANRDPNLEQKALEAWPELMRAVDRKDIDAIEQAVKVLRRYERRFINRNDKE